MPRLQLCRLDSDTSEFSVRAKPTHQTMAKLENNHDSIRTVEESARAATEARNTLALTNTMSQRMIDLAREFDCLGYFDSDDGPKAA